MSFPGTSTPANMMIVRIIVLAMLVVAPAAYLVVGIVLDGAGPVSAPAGNEVLVYILLVLALVEPAFGLVIESSSVRRLRSSRETKSGAEGLFLVTSLVKAALVEAVYIFGLVSFLITGKFTNMLYFYPIGIAWSFVYWPRREKYDRLVEKLNQP